VSFLILTGLLRRFKFFTSRGTSFDLSLLQIKNKTVLQNLINSANINKKIIFIHTGNQGNTLRVTDLVKSELNLNKPLILTSINEFSNSKWFESNIGDSGYYYLYKSRGKRFVSNRATKHLKVKSELNLTERVIQRIKTFFKAIRISHWSKNFLVFVPILAAHKVLSIETWVQGFVYFVSLSLIASGTYIFNDLVDLKYDFFHSYKHKRPLVSGAIPLKKGIQILLVLIISGFLLSTFFLNLKATVSLIIYFLLTLMYSFTIKKVLALDLVALALLHTIRVVGGALAITVPLSFWMLSFSMFIFFSMAAIKRSVEIANSGNKSIPGRPYTSEDLIVTNIVGISSGIASVLVFALYVQSPEVVNIYYRSPEILILAIPVLLYWVYYAWLNAIRKLIHHDPVYWALRDRGSLISLFLLLVIGLAASLIA
jgi:4-hydroxybenzoate polyprenyltransferase